MLWPEQVLRRGEAEPSAGRAHVQVQTPVTDKTQVITPAEAFRFHRVMPDSATQETLFAS